MTVSLARAGAWFTHGTCAAPPLSVGTLHRQLSSRWLVVHAARGISNQKVLPLPSSALTPTRPW
jgi:hypothetical protein